MSKRIPDSEGGSYITNLGHQNFWSWWKFNSREADPSDSFKNAADILKLKKYYKALKEAATRKIHAKEYFKKLVMQATGYDDEAHKDATMKTNNLLNGLASEDIERKIKEILGTKRLKKCGD